MGRLSHRVRRALATNAALPTVWPAALAAVGGLGLAASAAAALGYADVAVAAGVVAALAGVGAALVPAGLLTQVALPAWVVVAVAPALARLGEGRPVVAGLVAAVVFATSAIAQADEPTGRLVGALGGTAYVLAVGMGVVRDVPLAHAGVAGLVGLGAAALVLGVRRLLARPAPGASSAAGASGAAGAAVRLPGTAPARLWATVGVAAAERWASPWVRLAVRRVVVLAPLTAVLEAWRDPVALYALIVAFSVTQPAAADTLDRALARTAGVLGAVLVTVVLGLVAPDRVVLGVGAFAMVAGLAWLLRSPFLTTLGTTVLTVAGSVTSGSAAATTDRLVATLAGAAVGLAATVLIRGGPPAPSG